MELWSHEVKPGVTVSCDAGVGFVIHLSQAALGETKKGSENVVVFVKVGDQRLVIGTLSADKHPQISFDLFFDGAFELSHNSKTTSVFICGYKSVMPDMLESDSGDDEDLSCDRVVTKYKDASRILNNALELVVSECKAKAKIVNICEMGDSYIREQTSKVYKKRTIQKGIAFPTCLSVNNTMCHFSPLSNDETVLSENDMVKIDMGCHIDGFIAVVAHTHVITNGPVTGRAADVLAAANKAAEVTLRFVRPGKKLTDVTEAIQKVAAAYKCSVLGGCYQLKKFVIYGNEFDADTKVDVNEFRENEVYAIDITTSTGEAKPKLLDEKLTTIYKRAGGGGDLSTKASSSVFSGIMPFTARALEVGKSGPTECKYLKLLQAYPVLHEKPGDLVARIKFTVLLMPNGSDRITSHPLQELEPMKSIEDNAEIRHWLALSTKAEQKGKKGCGPITYCNSDVLIEIFKRCNAITLFRCGCVSKKWNKLIFDKTFLQEHYDRQKQRPLIHCRDFHNFKVLTFDVETLKRCLIADFTSPALYHKLERCFRVHASCNGILLISYHHNLFVCNPITRHWTCFRYPYSEYKMLCLYHHRETDTFRILIREETYARTHFYTSVGEFEHGTSELTERIISVESFDKITDPAPVQIGDSVFWVPMLTDAVSISVFDTVSETMNSIPVPPLTEKKIYWTSTRTEKKSGCISLLG